LLIFYRAFIQRKQIFFEKVKISYEHSHLPGYFVNASREQEKKPVLVLVDGLDGTAEKMYFILGPACEEQGLSALCVDGPGNGGSIRLNGLNHRYDAEVAAKAIFDYLETRKDVAPLVECPTLILHGENDAQVPLSDAEKTYNLLSGPKKLRVLTEPEQADQHGPIKYLGVVHMKPGDTVEVEVTGLGILENHVIGDEPVQYR
jgi:alpha-beta hydrolase superfamily lysophospholipase